MKTMRYLSFIICHLSFSVALTSCSDFFDPSNESVVATGEAINTQRQAFYQMNGILRCLQDVADSYLVTGELRADLLTTTKNSSRDLRDMEQFTADSANTYYAKGRYYALIRNCNYLIEHIDTTILVRGRRVLLDEYRQAKAIRAWAYLQLALDYGTVDYFTDARLEGQGAPQPMPFDQLIDVLIADLSPCCPRAESEQERMPAYGTIESLPSEVLFLPARFVLGELYMWKQDFSKAALMYYELMLNRRLTVRSSYRNAWNANATSDADRLVKVWTNQFEAVDTTNFVSIIPFNDGSVKTEGVSVLDSLFSYTAPGGYQLAPTATAVGIWQSQVYCLAVNNDTVGDLRGCYGSYTVSDGEQGQCYELTKWRNMTASHHHYVPIARSALVYLRFAEALNRLGKPQMAFAVLKHGLTRNVLRNDNYISATEKLGEPFTDFGQLTESKSAVFANNAPLHDRGSGNTADNEKYVITANNAADSLRFVEDRIIDEYALECAFEGNRFHDLMRIAIYRGDNAFLADRVAAKFSEPQRSAMRARLMDQRNWLLK